MSNLVKIMWFAAAASFKRTKGKRDAWKSVISDYEIWCVESPPVECEHSPHHTYEIMQK